VLFNWKPNLPVFVVPTTEEEAKCVWAMFDEECINNPPDVVSAQAMAKICANACIKPPNEVKDKLPKLLDLADVAHAVVPGGPIILGITLSPKFITFICVNMDGRPVKWADMTGQKQWDWCTVWKDTRNCDHARCEEETRGLRGVSLAHIPDQAGGRECGW